MRGELSAWLCRICRDESWLIVKQKLEQEAAARMLTALRLSHWQFRRTSPFHWPHPSSLSAMLSCVAQARDQMLHLSLMMSKAEPPAAPEVEDSLSW